MRGELICGCAASLALGACATPAADPRPNVLFILADDLGYGDLSVYNPQGRIRTPHLDRLASEGMRFTDAHSSAAVSTPTRYGLLTGCCPWRGPLKQGVIWTWADPLLTGERTLPAMLREAGYATALVGKWHLGIGFATTDGAPVDRAVNGANVDYTQPLEDGPTHHGFDCYYGDDVPNFPPYAFIENDRFPEIPDRPFEAGMPGVPGVMAASWRPERLLTVETEKAVAYIREHRDGPFFLMVSLTAPHTPIAPTPEFEGRSRAGRYGDFVEEMDHRIGELLAALRDAGIEERTIVVFSSDNGSSFQDGGTAGGERYGGRFGSILDLGHNPSGRFRGMKSDSWEGGHRIPFLVRWPGVIPAGSVTDALTCDLDLYATLADVAGVTLSEGDAVDSRSLMPLLRGGEPVRTSLVAQSGNGILCYIRDGWKLIAGSGSGGSLNPYGQADLLPAYDAASGRWRNVQLYNLASDPEERYDRAALHPQRVARMMEALAGEVRRGGTAADWQQVAWTSRFGE